MRSGSRTILSVVILSPSDGARVIEKGLAGPGLLAHVMVEKYADHLPLNRIEDAVCARRGAPGEVDAL